MRHIPYDEYVELLDKLHDQLAAALADELADEGTTCGILGVARGGLPAAVHLSHSLDLPMASIHVASYDDERQRGRIEQIGNDPYRSIDEVPDHIILVDDIVDSGGTMQFMRDYLVNLSNMIKPKRDIKVHTCAIVFKPTAAAGGKPDFAGMVFDSPDWVVFPYDDLAREARLGKGSDSD